MRGKGGGSGRRQSGGGRGRWHGGGRRPGGLYLLQPILLFSLFRGETHGYKLLEELESYGLQDLDPSVVYRMLRQMEAGGWVSSTWDKDGSQGPPRRVYILSQSGEEVLVSWIDELKKVNETITSLLKRSELDLRKGGKSDA